MDNVIDNTRMSNADMIQYCDEALGWEAFGPVDIYFFESVKKILLGQSSPFEEPDDDYSLMGIERPVQDTELEPEYSKFADIYYTEDEEDNVPDYTTVKVEEDFPEDEFGDGFFEDIYTENDDTVTIESSGYTIVE